jgi:hypothetical protein
MPTKAAAIRKSISGFLLLLVFLFSFIATIAQHRIRCGTPQNLERLKKQDATLEQRMVQDKISIDKWIAHHASMRTNNTIDTIPVVVHVVWRTVDENISDAQILSQIQILNQDYSRTNPDTINTPAVWQPAAGSLPYRFHLARRSPGGFPTTGIERRQTSHASFTTDDQVKFYSSGGLDAWDVNRYLNIWVCNLGPVLLGYAEYPSGTHTNTYGFVCHENAFGNIGTVVAPFNGGRTTTHEIGHCFNLTHIWGDDNGQCTGSDNISDTPNQSNATYGCYTFPNTDACSSTSPGIMFMNYMDYSDDNCMNMFTQGQTTAMEAALISFYPTLLISDGLNFVISSANDAGMNTIVSPSGTSCNDSIIPVVSIINFGSANLTSVTINFKVDNGAINTFAWTGTLPYSAGADVTLPSIAVTGGNHTFTTYTSNPNGVADGYHANDTTVTSFTISQTGVTIPLPENFETATFPPLNWEFSNPDAGITWNRITGYQHSGNASAYFDNFNYNASGEIDDMITPHVDLTGGINPALTFWVAYAYYTVPLQYSDTLEVLISTDCGITFTSLYKKWGDSLSTASPTQNPFQPDASDWRQESVNLTAFQASDNAYIVFRNISDFENNLYIDDILIDFKTGIDEFGVSGLGFEVSPNPVKDFLTVVSKNKNEQDVGIIIFNTLGEVMKKVFVSKNNSQRFTIDVSKLSAGIYFVQFTNSKGTFVSRIAISR